MTTPRTGRPFHRPKGSPNKHQRGASEDDHRVVLAVADAFHAAYGISDQKARALAVLELFAKRAEFNKCSKKMSAALKRFSGLVVSYDIFGIRGNDEEERALEKVLPLVNSLRKKADRYVTEADINYRAVMGSMFFLALFAKDNFMVRAFQIHLLSRQIDEKQIAAGLIEAMRIAEGLH
jgi:hypothetical protein